MFVMQLTIDELSDQRDVDVMMNCELPENPTPEEFTRIGPLQKQTAVKVLVHGERMLSFLDILEPHISLQMHFFEPYHERWEGLKQEMTSAEFGAIEVARRVYECRREIISGKFERLEEFVETLEQWIPLEGLHTKDVTWENVHATLLTVRV